MQQTTIGITLGDPCGIGSEILLKSLDFLRSLPYKFIVYGSEKALSHYARTLNLPLNLPSNVELLECYPLKEITPGNPDLNAAKAQITYIEKAVEDAKKGKIKAIVTLPINKETAAGGGFKFPGHTEFLAHLFNTKDFAMMLANEKLKVVLATTHVAFKDVPRLITTEKILSLLRLINQTLKNHKIAVAALNPHAGEGGLFGDEEERIINPAVKIAKKEGINVTGALPSDTVFVRAVKGEFDVVLCMYHDQGLIPIKLLGFGKSVNVTLGLPVIRTSVDHGTAYDIAGKGLAEPQSFQLAVKTAIDLLTRQS